MAKKQTWKVKIYTWLSSLLDKLNPVRYYKAAMVTPPVIVQDKFLQNVANETGLSIYQAKAVLSSIVRTAGDYMEAGNAVQLDEDFGTLKPFIKVKGVDSKEKCNVSSIVGVGIKFIPTGKMKSLLSDVQFTFVGTTDNPNGIDDSEVVNPEGGEPTQEEPSEEEPPTGGEQQGAENEQTPKTTYIFMHGRKIVATQQYTPGETVVAPEPPEGYEWSEYAEKAYENYDQVVTSCELHTLTFMHNGEVYATIQRGEGLDILIKAPKAPEGHKWDYNMNFTMGFEDRTIESQILSYELVLKHNDSPAQVFRVEYGSALASVIPAAQTGYHWVDVPETMPASRFYLYDAPDTNNPEYVVTYLFNGKLFAKQGYAEGQTITPPICGVSTGYHWADVPETMPAENLTIVNARDE